MLGLRIKVSQSYPYIYGPLIFSFISKILSLSSIILGRVVLTYTTTVLILVGQCDLYLFNQTVTLPHISITF